MRLDGSIDVRKAPRLVICTSLAIEGRECKSKFSFLYGFSGVKFLLSDDSPAEPIDGQIQQLAQLRQPEEPGGR